MDPTAVEIRVLGCLIEKQRTTPDAYPLSLNALRLACNQSTNRDPVVQYDEAELRDALQHLYRRGWTRLASGHGSRAAKYRHLLDEALGLARDEIALLAVLMLRGPQTPGELRQRTERLFGFADLATLQETLDRLIGRSLVARLARRPGQKEERYAQLLGGGVEDAVAGVAPAAPVGAPAAAVGAPAPVVAPAAPIPAQRAPAPAAPMATPAGPAGTPSAPPPAAPVGVPTPPPPAPAPRLALDDGRLSRVERLVAELRDDDRVDRLERELAELRDALRTLREALGE